MAADESSESGNTVFYEDSSTQFHGCGGVAAAEDERSYMNVGISDHSMSQATETKQPSKKVVSLTVEESSESSGDTVFYEDPTAEAQEMSHAAASSEPPPTPADGSNDADCAAGRSQEGGTSHNGAAPGGCADSGRHASAAIHPK